MTPEPGGEGGFRRAMKRAFLLFVVADTLLLVLGLSLYFMVFQPQLRTATAERDAAIRSGMALGARARAVEARYALTVMDLPAARMAAADVRAQLLGLAGRIPADRTTEVAEVRALADRAGVAENALDVDPPAARKDLEVIEAKLLALYPAVPPPPAKR